MCLAHCKDGSAGCARHRESPTLGPGMSSGRLKVKTAPSTFDRAYNEGTSTQVPTGRVIGVKGRFSRKIRYGGQNIVFERSAG